MTRTFPYSIDDQPVIFHVQATYDPGEFLEPHHFSNGYGKGWEITDVVVLSESGKEVTDIFPYSTLLRIANRNTDWPTTTAHE